MIDRITTIRLSLLLWLALATPAAEASMGYLERAAPSDLIAFVEVTLTEQHAVATIKEVFKGEPPDGKLILPRGPFKLKKPRAEYRYGTGYLRERRPARSHGYRPEGYSTPRGGEGSYIVFLRKSDGGYRFTAEHPSGSVLQTSGAGGSSLRTRQSDRLLVALRMLSPLMNTGPAKKHRLLNAAWAEASDKQKRRWLGVFYYWDAGGAADAILRSALRSPKRERWQPALWVVSGRKLKRFAPTLIRILENKDQDYSHVPRRKAARALGRMGATEAVDELLRVARERSAAALEAIRALGGFDDRRAVPVLIEIVRRRAQKESLWRDSRWVKPGGPGFNAEAAASALGNLQAPEAVGPIVDLIEAAPNKWHKEDIIRALVELEAEQAVSPLMELVEAAPSRRAKAMAIRGLGEIGSPAAEAIPLLWSVAEAESMREEEDERYPSAQDMREFVNRAIRRIQSESGKKK